MYSGPKSGNDVAVLLRVLSSLWQLMGWMLCGTRPRFLLLFLCGELYVWCCVYERAGWPQACDVCLSAVARAWLVRHLCGILCWLLRARWSFIDQHHVQHAHCTLYAIYTAQSERAREGDRKRLSTESNVGTTPEKLAQSRFYLFKLSCLHPTHLSATFASGKWPHCQKPTQWYSCPLIDGGHNTKYAVL